MSAPGRPRPDRPGRPSQDGNGHVAMSAGRGMVLVAVAVVVGIIILLTIDHSRPTTTASTSTATSAPSGGTSGGTTVTTAGGTTSSTTKAKKSTSTTAAPTKGARSNDQVVVQVLNASGVQGAATQRSNDLKAKGYQVLPAGNATGTRTGTGVQCRAGYEKEATVLAQTLGSVGASATVEPLPDPTPQGYDAAGNCYVVLGK